MNDTTLTMIGTLVDDPELKFTSSGAAVAKFRIANTPRKFDKDTNQWVDLKDSTLFMSCSIWRQAAENVAEGLRRGDRVVVVGRLRQRSYETQQGEKRTVYEVEADEVGLSLKFNSATSNRMKRSSGQSDDGSSSRPAARQSASAGPSGGPSGGFSGDPWANSGGGGFGSEEPPFSP